MDRHFWRGVRDGVLLIAASTLVCFIVLVAIS
jgi:hypothetical protein